METLFFLGFAFIVVIISFFKCKNFINPVFFYFLGLILPYVFLLFFYYSKFEIDEKIIDFNRVDINRVYNSLNITLLSIIVFSIPFLIFGFRKKYKLIDVDINLKLMKLSACFGMLLIIISCYILGGLPLLRMIEGAISIEDYNDDLINLPFGMLALINAFSILFVMIFSKKLVYEKLKLNSIFYFFVLCFLCFWQGKRQLFLIFVVFYLSLFLLKNKKFLSSIKYLFSMIFLLIFSFILIDYYRYGGIESNNFVMMGYISWPALNFSSLLSNNLNFSGDSFYFLKDIIPYRFLNVNNIDDIKSYLYEPTSPSGVLPVLWVSGKYFLIFFANLFFGFFTYISYYLYNKYDYKELYVLNLWVCISSGIYSHFLSINFYIIPYILFFVIFKINNKNKKANCHTR